MCAKRGIRWAVVGVCGLWVAACPRRFDVRIPVQVELGANLGTFVVQAGVPLQNHGAARLGETGLAPEDGAVTISADAITVTLGGGGKGAVNLHEGGELFVTVRIAAADQVDVVCEQGEVYGPFDFSLDAFYVPESVTPSEVTLTQTTLDLLNGGEFTVCLEVTSPLAATVTVDALTFRLSL